eukprot:7898931-Pyramimonas_sp.AAC.1
MQSSDSAWWARIPVTGTASPWVMMGTALSCHPSFASIGCPSNLGSPRRCTSAQQSRGLCYVGTIVLPNAALSRSHI